MGGGWVYCGLVVGAYVQRRRFGCVGLKPDLRFFGEYEPVRFFGAIDGGEGNIPVERYEASASMHGQCEQIRIGNLAVSEYVVPIQGPVLERVSIGGPEFV